MNDDNQYETFGQDEVLPLPVVPVKKETQIPVDPVNSNILTVLNRGDNIIQKAHTKAYIIVGLTRKGKSTTFNWMLRRHLMGHSKKEGQAPYYINAVEGDQDSAAVGNSYSSVTLAPNVHVDFENDVSLIDMAGFQDKRNYIGVIGVSYFLKQVFERVRKVKFVIVISESMFSDTSGQELIRTFQGFINMFEYNKQVDKQIRKELRAKLRQSIVLVITKSEKHYQHSDRLKLFINKLKDRAFIVENKDAIIEILTWMHSKLLRLQPFKAAARNKPAQPCTFVEQLNNNQRDPWQFFDLDEAEKINKKPLIAFPFKRDFQRMQNYPQQVELFQAAIDSRIKSYEGFAFIAQEFINLFFQNWQNFINTQDVGNGKFKDLKFYKTMDRAFEKVKHYVKENNVYQQSILKNFTYRNPEGQITFVQALTKILEIFKKVEELTTRAQGNFIDHMQQFNIDYTNIIDCFRCFATNPQEQQLLHKLQYIVKRGFKDFSRLYQLKKDCIADAGAKLSDYFTINGFFEPSVKRGFQKKIIQNMNEELFGKMFNNFAKLDEYEVFFMDYQNQQNDLDQVFMKEHMQKIETHKAGLYLKTDQKKEAIRCYIRIYFYLDQLSAIINSSATLNEEEKNYELQKYSMKKIKTVRKIVDILKVLPQNDKITPMNVALNLCVIHNMIEDVSELYELTIQNSNVPLDDRITYYRDYALHCAKWGQLEKAIGLMLKRLKLSEQDYSSKLETINCLKQFNSLRMNYYKQFGLNLNTLTRLPIQDQSIRGILLELQINIT